jgi:hypothetical protein
MTRGTRTQPSPSSPVEHHRYSNPLVKTLHLVNLQPRDKVLTSRVVKSSFVTCRSSRVECTKEATCWFQHEEPGRFDWIIANNWTADDVNP